MVRCLRALWLTAAILRGPRVGRKRELGVTSATARDHAHVDVDVVVVVVVDVLVDLLVLVLVTALVDGDGDGDEPQARSPTRGRLPLLIQTRIAAPDFSHFSRGCPVVLISWRFRDPASASGSSPSPSPSTPIDSSQVLGRDWHAELASGKVNWGTHR